MSEDIQDDTRRAALLFLEALPVTHQALITAMAHDEGISPVNLVCKVWADTIASWADLRPGESLSAYITRKAA